MKNFFKKAWRSFAAAIAASVVAILGIFGLHDAESASPTITDTLTWSHPTQYVDDSVLPLSAIAATRIAWGTTPGGPYPNVQDVAAPLTTLALVRPNEGYGTRCYRAATLTVAGRLSDYTPEGCKTVAVPPKSPSALSVQ